MGVDVLNADGIINQSPPKIECFADSVKVASSKLIKENKYLPKLDHDFFRKLDISLTYSTASTTHMEVKVGSKLCSFGKYKLSLFGYRV